MVIYPKPIKIFNWSDLDGKILKISVVQPDPSNNEPYGQVFAMDETGTVYLLQEWHYKHETDSVDLEWNTRFPDKE